ncbi:MAG: hypothetical protein R3244_02420, partial [Thermoanaerobaculia bacterium]|nr:hypothetical protein [Thermoanaerobaculia bacterium]
MTRYDDRLLDLLAWSVGAVVLLLFAARFFAHTADDAYISFRYAENWARGLGPVFNAGEPVEGYSNFSWVAILAFVHLLGPGPPTAAAVLGVACAVALVGLCVRHGPRTSSAWLRAAAPLWVAASPPLAVWASAGLE